MADVESSSYSWRNRLGGRKPAAAQPMPAEAAPEEPEQASMTCPACGATFNLTPAEQTPPETTPPPPEA